MNRNQALIAFEERLKLGAPKITSELQPLYEFYSKAKSEIDRFVSKVSPFTDKQAAKIELLEILDLWMEHQLSYDYLDELAESYRPPIREWDQGLNNLVSEILTKNKELKGKGSDDWARNVNQEVETSFYGFKEYVLQELDHEKIDLKESETWLDNAMASKNIKLRSEQPIFNPLNWNLLSDWDDGYSTYLLLVTKHFEKAKTWSLSESINIFTGYSPFRPRALFTPLQEKIESKSIDSIGIYLEPFSRDVTIERMRFTPKDFFKWFTKEFSEEVCPHILEELLFPYSENKAAPTHGNAKGNELKRTIILETALIALKQWPEECIGRSNLPSAERIALCIDNHSVLLFQEAHGISPLGVEATSKLLRKRLVQPLIKPAVEVLTASYSGSGLGSPVEPKELYRKIEGKLPPGMKSAQSEEYAIRALSTVLSMPGLGH